MQTNQSSTRKERILFDLLCCVNELNEQKDELSILDIDDLEKLKKKLSRVIQDKRRQSNQVFALYV